MLTLESGPNMYLYLSLSFYIIGNEIRENFLWYWLWKVSVSALWCVYHVGARISTCLCMCMYVEARRFTSAVFHNHCPPYWVHLFAGALCGDQRLTLGVFLLSCSVCFLIKVSPWIWNLLVLLNCPVMFRDLLVSAPATLTWQVCMWY